MESEKIFSKEEVAEMLVSWADGIHVSDSFLSYIDEDIKGCC
jgi:hypothetical protein